MANEEQKLVRGWRSKIGLLIAIITPTVALTGAFYSVKLDAQDREAKMNERVAALELSSQKNFVEKDELHEIREDVKQLRSEVSDIKTLLIRQHQ